MRESRKSRFQQCLNVGRHRGRSLLEQLLWFNVSLSYIINEYISVACYVYTWDYIGIIFTCIIIVWNEITPGTEIISISLVRSVPTENPAVEPKFCATENLPMPKWFLYHQVIWWVPEYKVQTLFILLFHVVSFSEAKTFARYQMRQFSHLENSCWHLYSLFLSMVLRQGGRTRTFLLCWCTWYKVWYTQIVLFIFSSFEEGIGVEKTLISTFCSRKINYKSYTLVGVVHFFW